MVLACEVLGKGTENLSPVSQHTSFGLVHGSLHMTSSSRQSESKETLRLPCLALLILHEFSSVSREGF